jgi:hypothetical protein
MTFPKKPTFAFLLLALGALVGGCSMQPQKYSTIPQARPASWENQIPGMGQPTGR